MTQSWTMGDKIQASQKMLEEQNEVIRQQNEELRAQKEALKAETNTLKKDLQELHNTLNTRRSNEPTQARITAGSNSHWLVRVNNATLCTT